MIKDLKTYSRNLLSIALPIIMGNLGFILIGAGNVLVAGRHSTDTLAAISIATAILNCIFMIGIGLVSSVTPILSNIRGKCENATKYFYPTIRFSSVISILIMLIIWSIIPLIDYLGFEKHLVPAIKEFMWITSLSSIFVFIHCGIKEFLQAHEIVVFPNILMIACVFINVGLCAALVFGWGVFPEMGVVGLAVASLIVRILLAVVLFIYTLKIMKLENFVDIEYYKNIFRVGLPIALAILIEFIAFNIIAVLMGRVAGVYAAAHNLVYTLTTVSFMVPLAISNAIAVRVGYANGAQNYTDLKKYSYIGMAISAGFMMFSSIIFATFPEFLVGLFTKDSELIIISIPIMLVLAMFQVFDGLQISFSGIFKGIKKTKFVMIANLIAYWGISIPLGYILAFKYGMGLIGFWYGLLTAAILLCFLMTLFLRKVFSQLANCEE